MAGDKDRKSAEQQQAIKSKNTAKERGLDAVENGNHNQRSRSRSSRRGERSEDSRGGSHGRVRHTEAAMRGIE
ncbi:hypothetical protein PC123_g21964 [Phytophthora cactorum]|nr:hypothetical protein PC120_g22283 [Phytophthora cactorum]KAG4042553.1 hypothetical protein PC123_g21964 [Phytophthora cactorum]